MTSYYSVDCIGISNVKNRDAGQWSVEDLVHLIILELYNEHYFSDILIFNSKLPH